jgi:hypothetical protein
MAFGQAGPQRLAWRDVVPFHRPIPLPARDRARREVRPPSRQVCAADRLTDNGRR